MGSTKDDVRALLGPADRIDGTLVSLGYESWEYSTPDVFIYDSITFDTETGLVIGWSNWNGTLPVSVRIGNRDLPASPFGIGSTRDQVFAANGTPTTLDALYGTETWTLLSESSEYFWNTDDVTFNDDGRVVRWSNNHGELNVTLGELSADTGAQYIDIGVSMSDVLRLQGTPVSIDASYIEYTQSVELSWPPPTEDDFFGSSVTFSAVTKQVTGWDNAGDLKLSP